jgi:hypothetical protein
MLSVVFNGSLMSARIELNHMRMKVRLKLPYSKPSFVPNGSTATGVENKCQNGHEYEFTNPGLERWVFTEPILVWPSGCYYRCPHSPESDDGWGSVRRPDRGIR